MDRGDPVSDTPDRPRKRIEIDAPSEAVILAARHLDATEGPVQVGSIVDTATRSAITTVLRYIATAHNSPAVEGPADEQPIGDIQLTRHLGHGLVVDTAPRRSRIALTVLADAKWGATVASNDQVNIADQVLYQVVGYDPEAAVLVLELVEDWRPVPTAKLSETEVEEIRSRWLALHGKPGTAHPVKPLDEENADA
jgi:hypothetical protein